MVLAGHAGECQQAVEPGDDLRVGENHRHILGQTGHQPVVEPCLDGLDALLGGEYLLLVFLELGGDVALGVDQGLLAYPLRRHLALVGVGHLDIVAEDIVVADFQARDAGGLAFALLYLLQVVFPLERHQAQLVKLLVDAGFYDVALVEGVGRVVGDFAGYAVAHQFAGVEALPH